MKSCVRTILVLWLVVMAFPLLADEVSIADEDAALFKSCPELSAWAAKHPREGRDMDSDSHVGTPPISSTLGTELSRRADLDQRVRAPLSVGQIPSQEQLQRLAEVDADNLRWLKHLVAHDGFPTVEQVGQKGVRNAWLLVQHADADPVFQQEVLDSLIARSSTSGLKKADLAMLSDRVLLALGQPQRYGTQFVQNKEGDLVLQDPVEDMADIDARRAQMDLMPLDLYRCVLRASYE
ncbi:DUF6624 domain-containing protein [Denitratimonas tolerans]|uniref:DUF6624 domain-containing protein n=2 Tax=Pseudomonadota TaxID=1224 RepID=A0AAW9RDT1_9GAMM